MSFPALRAFEEVRVFKVCQPSSLILEMLASCFSVDVQVPILGIVRHAHANSPTKKKILLLCQPIPHLSEGIKTLRSLRERERGKTKKSSLVSKEEINKVWSGSGAGQQYSRSPTLTVLLDFWASFVFLIFLGSPGFGGFGALYQVRRHATLLLVPVT